MFHKILKPKCNRASGSACWLNSPFPQIDAISVIKTLNYINRYLGNEQPKLKCIPLHGLANDPWQHDFEQLSLKALNVATLY